ncbi:MAG: hypothetical protein HY238_20920 [Acidobacteria bacterium]|nr:hypothetical protein [Acidobacteriota bacterium]
MNQISAALGFSLTCRRVAQLPHGLEIPRQARLITAAEKAMVRQAAQRQSETVAKSQLGAEHWVHNVNWREALELRWSTVSLLAAAS